MVDLKDAPCQRAEEIPVVAHQHHRAGEFLQRCKQYLPGLEVEVVGGLVKNQEMNGPGKKVASSSRLFSPPERLITFFSTASP